MAQIFVEKTFWLNFSFRGACSAISSNKRGGDISSGGVPRGDDLFSDDLFSDDFILMLRRPQPGGWMIPTVLFYLKIILFRS